jgi:hypothetical protein
MVLGQFSDICGPILALVVLGQFSDIWGPENWPMTIRATVPQLGSNRNNCGEFGD